MEVPNISDKTHLFEISPTLADLSHMQHTGFETLSKTLKLNIFNGRTNYTINKPTQLIVTCVYLN